MYGKRLAPDGQRSDSGSDVLERELLTALPFRPSTIFWTFEFIKNECKEKKKNLFHQFVLPVPTKMFRLSQYMCYE